MKRLYVFLLSIMLFVGSFAQTNGNEVSMVSYEQSWLDNYGTLALKNNTEEDIHNVTFRITYLDMSDNALDYEEFTRDIEIAPGMTKKTDIPAYEHSRDYHYYKTKDDYGHPAFKINFELKDYNSNMSQKTEEELPDILNSYTVDIEDEGISDYTMSLIGMLFLLLIIGAWVGLYIMVAVMAQSRNRSVVIWVLLSIIATPILMIIILLIVGDEDREVDQYDR